jgi:negative regulator of sigma E activity
MKQMADSPEQVASAKERISVLLDGELNRTEAERVIAAVCSDPGLLREWHELHRAGDALRSHEVAAWDADGFCTRVMAALVAEPTVLAPRAMRVSGVRRYWMPGLAVAASVAAVSFIALPLLRTQDTAPIAKNVGPVVQIAADDAASQKVLPTIANARGLGPTFSPYVTAHRELSASSVVPRAAVYLRSNEDR